MKTTWILILASIISCNIAVASLLCLPLEKGLDKMCARQVQQDSDCEKISKDTIAWNASSCVLEKGDEVIPEILALANDAEVPASVYQQYPPAKIAISLIYRYFQKVERPQMNKADLLKPSYNVFDQTESIIAFNSDHIDSIIKNGFLNQFELGTKPRAGNYMQYRVMTEDYLSGVKLSSNFEIGNYPINQVRPKYAYGIFKSTGSALLRNSLDSRYGNSYAVFKDSVKKRMTLTNLDSLAGVVTKHPKFKRISMYYSSSKFELPDLHSYYETQIWGPVGMNDVAYFLTGCLNGEADQQLLDGIERASIGVPVYKCKMA